jgi:hypothetical protein
MKLTLRHHTVDSDFHARIDALVGDLAEWTHMPAGRRAERINLVAPELLAIVALCDGVAVTDMMQSLIETDGYAGQLAHALNHLHPI